MADPKKPKKDAAEIPADAETPAAAAGEPGAVEKEVEAVKKPAAKKPAAKKPAAKKASGEKAEKPTATAKAKDEAKSEAAQKKPATKAEAKADEKPAAKAKAEKKPAAKAKADEKPAAKAKADDKPAAKAKADDKPAAKAKADEEPAAKAKADEEPAAKAKADEKPAAKAKPPATTARRRGAGRREDQPAVLVRAQARYVRSSARKARLVCDAIRGKDVEQARAILAFHPRAVAEAWEKLLGSAVANAENNHDLDGDELKIHAVFADEGPTIKRFRPRAMGRATPIHKRTSHLTIQLAPKETR